MSGACGARALQRHLAPEFGGRRSATMCRCLGALTAHEAARDLAASVLAGQGADPHVRR